MADSLFDNRYRYDYIYPRGRSGETLRAVDTQMSDRPVVIKRPAPSDAPPIRNGQEVSIVTERRVLSRLAGHPVVTELLGEGQFVVSGVPHQYIVMERAEGIIIADEVLALAAQGERLPELEMLVIADRLLDLLYAAHAQDIVYNDVDAKHLFWNRENYRLKVIDWGNAVFLEGDDATPQGISRLSDIYQVGELLYFILTGGRRPEVPRDAGEGFIIDFGEDAERVAPRLQEIISKALHPQTRMRHRYVTEMRRDLADYRAPLERERDSIVARIVERLRRSLSKNELQSLLGTLDGALSMDPGYPAARQTQAQIMERMQDLNVDASLDAVQIYLESANWGRAVQLLNELRDKAGSTTRMRVNLLLDCALLLMDSALSDSPDLVPPAIFDAIALIFEGRVTDAAQTLLLEDPPDDDTRKLQWLLAERISSHVPEALLLRPNLYRLELSLANLVGEGISLAEPRTLLSEIRHMLDGLGDTSNVAALRDRYRDVVDRLSTLNTLLSTLAVQHNLSNRKLPLTSMDRALNAAMALADNMHVIGKQATTSPRDAMTALDNSRSIDPTSPAWEKIYQLLDGLYRRLQGYQTYVPTADGNDLEAWLAATRADLQPFTQSLFDELLTSMVSGLETANKSWQSYADSAIRGDRAGAVQALTTAIDSVSTISPTLAGWLNQLRSIVERAAYIERHALYGGLGRALADGWEAFDRSRLPDAERLGQEADKIATNEAERFAAVRLREASKFARDWVQRNTVQDAKRTKLALEATEALFTEDEIRVRESFSTQMPSKETYLKAMGKGIVEIYQRGSTAASRLLAFHYVLMGTLDAHDGLLEDAVFWRDAAVRALGEHGPRHVLTRTLDEFVERRRDINRVVGLLDGVNGPAALEKLEKTRRLIEENPQAKALAGAVQSLRDFEIALRDWAEGEFRAAGLKMENALQSLREAESGAAIKVPRYREWLEKLHAAAAELHVQARNMRQVIEKRPVEPDDTVRHAHHKMAQVTTQMLGEKTAATLVQWRDTYERFLTVYADPNLRRSHKLERFNDLFRAMFIDRHPAYPLYRSWYDAVEASPEFPAPPTNEPTPRIDEDAEVRPEPVYRGDDEDYDTFESFDEPAHPAQRGSRRPRGLLVIGLLLLLIVVGGGIAFAVLSGGDDGGDPFAGLALTLTATPDATGGDSELTPTIFSTADMLLTPENNPFAMATANARRTATAQRNAGATLSDFVTPTLRSEQASATATTRAATNTPAVTATETETPEPSVTATPAPTDTPTVTPTATATPTATLPPGGLQGQQDLIDVLARLESGETAWTEEQFSLGVDGAYWRLGIGAQTGGDEIRVSLPPEVLDRYYGGNAAGRIRRVEASMSLLTADPTLPEDQVYFGLMLARADGSDTPLDQAGIIVQVQSLTVINLYQRIGSDRAFITQRAVNAVVGRLRIDHDLDTGRVTLFFNDAQLGQPIEFGTSDVPVVPVLFVKEGGVVVSVNTWRVTLD